MKKNRGEKSPINFSFTIILISQKLPRDSPSISHRKPAVSGPPHPNACQRKSFDGSITAQRGISVSAHGSAQYPSETNKGFEFLFGIGNEMKIEKLLNKMKKKSSRAKTVKEEKFHLICHLLRF